MTTIRIPAGTTVHQTIPMTLVPDVEGYVKVPVTVTLEAARSPSGVAYTYTVSSRTYRVRACDVDVIS